jgi:hypothetical protein
VTDFQEAFRIAREQLEERAANGDLAGMYDKWLRILHVEGENYRSALSSAPPDYRAAAGAALGALIATAGMIPVEPQNLPSLQLLQALQEMIIDAANGAKKHPILLIRAHLRGHGKGVTMERQHIKTLAVTCARVLQRWDDAYADFISQELSSRGVAQCSANTVRSWVNRSNDEPFGGAQADGILADPDFAREVDQLKTRAEAEAFCVQNIDRMLGKPRVAITP